MKKKLYRNTEEGLLSGVLAGLAEYFEHDVVLYRLLFVVLLVLTGLMPGVLVYVAAYFIIPERPTIEPVSKEDYTVYN